MHFKLLYYQILNSLCGLVIPGGGSGQNGYPEWTKTRTLAAHEHYLSLEKGEYNVTAAAFLALSAGSLNVCKEMIA